VTRPSGTRVLRHLLGDRRELRGIRRRAEHAQCADDAAVRFERGGRHPRFDRRMLRPDVPLRHQRGKRGDHLRHARHVERQRHAPGREAQGFGDIAQHVAQRAQTQTEREDHRERDARGEAGVNEQVMEV
jgi:hypothetical protein